MVAYIDRHELCNGNAVVYKRSGSAKGTYQVRLKLDGVRYIVESLRTSDRQTADKLAEDRYHELRIKQRDGLDISQAKITFTRAWTKFLQEAGLSKDRNRLFESTGRLYFSHYFGERRVTELNSLILEKYFQWRRVIWLNRLASDPESVPANVARSPSKKTLSMERAMLLQFLRWATRHGYISRVPEIDVKQLVTPSKDDRRATFTKVEFEQLRNLLQDWCEERTQDRQLASGGRLHSSGPNGLHRQQRMFIRDYVILLARSGLRPGEGRKLKWKHVRVNGGQLLLQVAPDTKTGTRTVVCIAGTGTVLERIRKYSSYCSDDDYVFPGSDGNEHKNLNKSFQSFLKKYRLLHDVHGGKRCCYSLRHFYATQQLAEGVDAHVLARNMGTSTAHIDKHYSHILSTDRAEVLAGRAERNFGPAKKGLVMPTKARAKRED